MEKTSKRGGRIVHESDEPLPPVAPMMPPPIAPPPRPSPQSEKPEAKMAHILRNPSKVALLRVGGCCRACCGGGGGQLRLLEMVFVCEGVEMKSACVCILCIT